MLMFFPQLILVIYTNEPVAFIVVVFERASFACNHHFAPSYLL